MLYLHSSYYRLMLHFYGTRLVMRDDTLLNHCHLQKKENSKISSQCYEIEKWQFSNSCYRLSNFLVSFNQWKRLIAEGRWWKTTTSVPSGTVFIFEWTSVQLTSPTWSPCTVRPQTFTARLGFIVSLNLISTIFVQVRSVNCATCVARWSKMKKLKTWEVNEKQRM